MAKTVLVGIFLVLSACDSVIPERIKEHTETLKNIIEHHPQNDVSVDIDRHQFLRAVRLIKVDDGVRPLYTTGRQEKIQSTFCGECHDDYLKRLKLPKREPKKSHWNIALRHGDAQTMNCQTCHGSDDKTSLTMLDGTAVSFDRTDKVCSQCHTDQVKDWKNSAHGKSVGGWAPPRVIQNCAECHNPHRPSFPKRFPSRLVKSNE